MLKLPKIEIQYASANLEEKIQALVTPKKIRQWVLMVLSNLLG